MKWQSKLILTFTTLLVFSTWCYVKRESNYSLHLLNITKEFMHEMDKKHGISCMRIGRSLGGNVKKVSVQFYCYEKKSIEEARNLHLNCVERYCEMINSHKKIRPYLEKFPFTNDRVEIMICFCKKNLKIFPPEESISIVESCNDKISYKLVFTDFHLDRTVLEETYEEAYEKVRRASIEGP